jgi:predicted signal transduction protein with EAL and GGDEF domain
VGGISIVSCDILRSIDELYVRADQALYRAKAGGRDRVVMASDRLEVEPEVDLDREAFQQDV